MIRIAPNTPAKKALEILRERAAKGVISLGTNDLRERVSPSLSRDMFAVIVDELESQGLVQSVGGRGTEYQLTVAGYDLLENENETIDSAAWTGDRDRFKISERKQHEIVKRISELKRVIETCDLTNEQKSQAIAQVTSAISLAEAPQPVWHVVKELLYLIAAIAAPLAFAAQIASMIR